MPHSATTHLPHIRFDSLATSPTTALEYWRDSLSRSWEMSIDAHNAPAFKADVAMWRMDDLIVGTGSFGPVQTRMRREKNIRFDQLDHYRLIMMRDGQFDCDAGGRQVSLSPGRYVLTDMALPESSESCSNTMIMYIPRESLERALPRPMNLHGASPVNACAGMLTDHLTALIQGIRGVSPEELPGLSQATVNLVAASLALTPDNGEAARPAVEAVLLRRARQQVETHLTSESFGAQDLCAQLRISRSTLYRLFETLGGVANYIKERRLARVHEILASSEERQNISRLAEGHGFKTAAHFSKAFREQFGYSAREVPKLAAPGRAVAGAGKDARFDAWLGTLYN
jgi:AraC-like DNA-binding protein